MNKMKLFRIFIFISLLSLSSQKTFSEINVEVEHLIVQDYHSEKSSSDKTHELCLGNKDT